MQTERERERAPTPLIPFPPSDTAGRQSCVPFTPVTGPRLLARGKTPEEASIYIFLYL
jgi:hypothetical protein